MNTLSVLSLLLALLASMTGGCTSQPPAKAQADLDVSFVLKTTMIDGRMVFVGIGGEIDGVANPDLVVQQGSRVRVTLVNDDGMLHDFAVPDLNAQTTMVSAKGQSTEVVFEISEGGEFAYYCTVPGHRQAGMEGRLIVSEP
jgi:nitrite reductase (NO-forming)